MRVLMVTSFPIPGGYDGTAMLPIKIMRALRQRGVDVTDRGVPNTLVPQRFRYAPRVGLAYSPNKIGGLL